MTQTSSRDFELLSAYLDEQLSQAERARLATRIKADPELRAAYEGLRQTRALLRQLPARRAPRNFRLSPQMLGIKPRLPRSFPIFRMASVLASILLFLGYAINLTAPAASMGAAVSQSYDAYSSEAPALAETEAPMPEMATESATLMEEPTATPEVSQGLMPKVAPTATVEEALTTPDAMQNTNVAPGDRIMAAGTQSTEMAMPAMPPPAFPIHPGWLFGLLGLAVVSGTGAFVVRLRAEQNWKPSARDIVLITLALAIVIALAMGIYWMSAQ